MHGAIMTLMEQTVATPLWVGMASDIMEGLEVCTPATRPERRDRHPMGHMGHKAWLDRWLIPKAPRGAVLG